MEKSEPDTSQLAIKTGYDAYGYSFNKTSHCRFFLLLTKPRRLKASVKAAIGSNSTHSSIKRAFLLAAQHCLLLTTKHHITCIMLVSQRFAHEYFYQGINYKRRYCIQTQSIRQANIKQRAQQLIPILARVKLRAYPITPPPSPSILHARNSPKAKPVSRNKKENSAANS